MTKFLNISTDNTLGGSSASDETVSSQKAIKEYIDSKAPEIDGISITQNSNDELQTIGVIDQNNTSNAIKTWSGTKAQYNAIVTKDSNTLYNITDDTTLLLSVPNLFDFKWADHELNSQCWLRADTYSWQDGTVYSDAYNHLVDDIDGKTATSETIGSYTISYYLANDGHKITTDETNVQNIYNSTGVAWYYVLDTANQRFKLPRTKYGFTGLRDTVGKYVPESLPNIKGSVLWTAGAQGKLDVTSATGCFYQTSALTSSYPSPTGSSSIRPGFDLNASLSSSTYQDNAPVQQRATQMYLYFYVGQFSQSATEQTAGLNSELFNGKADVDLNNLSASGVAKFTAKLDLDLNNINNTNNVAANNLNSKGIRTVITSYSSGTSWYRLYSDGWVEQGGQFSNSSTNQNQTVTLLKTMSNTRYFISLQRIRDTYDASATYSVVRSVSTGSFTCYGLADSTRWEVKGYSAG